MSIRHEMITGRWTLLVEDSHADDDAYLDEVPLTGTVTFTPVWPDGVVAAPAGGDDEPLRLVATQPVTALVADGILTDLQGREGQPLPVQIGEVELWWRARFNVAYQGIEVPLNPLLVDATEGPVELSTLFSAKGYPDDDLSGLESIRATVRRQAREVANALDLVNRAAASVEDLERRAEEAIRQAEEYLRQVKGLIDDAESIRRSTGEIRDEVHDWYEQLSTDTQLIIDAVNGHVDSIASGVTADADRAKQEADRAGDAARVEVTRQISDVVDGAPEDLDTLRELAEYASENRDMLDQVNEAIANKAAKDHGHEITGIDGLKDALDGKVNTVTDGARLYGTTVAGSQTRLQYSSQVTPGTVAYRATSGATLSAGDPTGADHLTTKRYVDAAVPTIVVVDAMPDTPDATTIYLVREPE
ncbi:hypothetical protein ACT3SZ_16170 [Corynebacterium sp. AOP40-9SA-29]|uniref:hypothetical protein n=1 Tax=Corynebacterium sp. AOP40-9SA-29 TaxID=3457677 RepID=UPI0040346E48